MSENLISQNRKFVGFAGAALRRAQEILARAEAAGDAYAIDKWRRVVSTLELEAAREVVTEMRRAA